MTLNTNVIRAASIGTALLIVAEAGVPERAHYTHPIYDGCVINCVSFPFGNGDHSEEASKVERIQMVDCFVSGAHSQTPTIVSGSWQ